MAGQAVVDKARELASFGSLRLVLPECAKGIGSVILAPDSPKLIAGVRLQPIALWPDDRGYFGGSAANRRHGLACRFSAVMTSQISAALSYPGSNKSNT